MTRLPVARLAPRPRPPIRSAPPPRNFLIGHAQFILAKQHAQTQATLTERHTQSQTLVEASVAALEVSVAACIAELERLIAVTNQSACGMVMYEL